MSSGNPPLTCKEIKAILAYLGFAKSSQRGSHEQWVCVKDGRKYKVTVDCPKQPFAKTLLDSMAKQACYSRRDFYTILQKL
jgi:predicted RNA binding protein YcfA (HicA-like mRNA interferase family)